MKKLFFRFDFSPKIKKFLTTLHNTQEQAILWIIRQLLPFLFPRHCPLLRQTSSLRKFYPWGMPQRTPSDTLPCMYALRKACILPHTRILLWLPCLPKEFSKRTFSFLYNKKTRPIMSAFKYQNRRGLADFFCQELCRYRLSQLRDLVADAVIPVPIHKNKYKKRGYNQAALLSSRLALTLNLPHYPDMLIRSVDTLTTKTSSIHRLVSII